MKELTISMVWGYVKSRRLGFGVAHTFYPFVENEKNSATSPQTPVDHQQVQTSETEDQNETTRLEPTYGARIAVVDTPFAAPRVVVVDPQDTRSYLEEITQTVSSLAQQEGSTIPFMVIREIVENFIHAYFKEPTISILNHGNIIRFSDQGPGIPEKDKAFSFGTTSATKEMKQYIRGVGSGLPYVKAYMEQTHGYISVEDNISGGCIVTLYAHKEDAPHTPKVDKHPVQNQYTTQQPAYSQPNYSTVQNIPQENYYTETGYVPQSYIPTQQVLLPSPITPQTTPTQTTTPYAERAYSSPFEGAQNQHATIHLSVRAKMILSAVRDMGSIGPSELCRMYGLSQPTWSRELKNLEDLGVLHKSPKEQKRTLTTLGRTFLQNIAQEL